nr:non-homologous end-joining DNA ligase [uncultured Flavobacterium sp.]
MKTKKETKGTTSKKINTLLKKGVSAKIPSGVKPMLATLVNEPFDDPDWIYEIKWDGYRAVSYINKGSVSISSRNNKSFEGKYYPIASVMGKWSINAVLDGEIVVIGKDGKANFSALQNWRSEADGNLIYYVFDLLWYNDTDIMSLTLTERQDILKEILPTNDDRVRLSQSFTSNGLDFFAAAKKMGLEGIMAKKANSAYSANSRNKEWVKIKANLRQEVVIGGFTKNDGTSKQFSSLLLGVFENKNLQYVGKVGTGFSDKLQKEMMQQFIPLITEKVPFASQPDINKPSRFRPNPPNAVATWLKPALVCEVNFAEVTSDGVFRHPSFEGMRLDKKASEVVRETAAPTTGIIADLQEKNPSNKSELVTAPEHTGRKTLLNPSEASQVKKIKGHSLKFTNLSKVYWPEDGYTKRDMFNYYYQAAEYILPYLKDRPLSLNRFPGGIHGPGFYQPQNDYSKFCGIIVTHYNLQN